jgi:asparagine synthase (glutamine-hydrolysing)
MGGGGPPHAQGAVDPCALRRMARSLRHRGPDGWGLAVGDGVGLVATRLAVVDVPHGWQPLQSPAGSVLVYNGEVYNAPELRTALMRSGLSFTSRSDTEVVLRLLEHEGLAGLDRCNGGSPWRGTGSGSVRCTGRSTTRAHWSSGPK